jgi:hypothetical protein
VQVRGLLSRAEANLDMAQLEGNLNAANGAIREVRGTIVLLAKVAAELREGPNMSIRTTPEWLAMRTALFDVLEPYPDAKRAVVDLVLDSKEASEPYS